MRVSAIKVAVISAFLILGMFLGGVITQPKASVDVWEVKENDFPINGGQEDKLKFLLNYAILAPSSHNSQPWKFNVSGDEIRLYGDRSKWLRVADTDQREFYISLGCALENMAIAAEHFGYNHSITYFPTADEEDLVAVVRLNPNGQPSRNTRLFDAILTRHTNRKLYENRPILESEIQLLQSMSAERDPQLYMTSDLDTRNKLLELIVRANKIQYNDPDYKSELGFWLGQGVMGPTGIMAKIAQLVVVLFDTGSGQSKTDVELINSTPTLGFISSKENDRVSQVKAGQLFERVWLAAEAHGIRVHPMSQALEVSETKAEATGLIPKKGLYLQQIFRLGYAEPEKGHTPRWPAIAHQFLIIKITNL